MGEVLSLAQLSVTQPLVTHRVSVYSSDAFLGETSRVYESKLLLMASGATMLHSDTLC